MVQKKNIFKENDIISASEIGQYQYCSISWFLQKCGYYPKSDSLDSGLIKHKNIGKIIDNIDRKQKKSRLLLLIGYLLFFIALIILLFEVFL
jgi:hypothetical protein